MRSIGWYSYIVTAKVEKLLAVSRMIIRNQISYYPPVVMRFERAFARAVGTKHAAVFSNGTSAIEAAVFALGIGEGDEIIAPSYTIHSTFSAALALGAAVRFADIDLTTLTIDPPRIESLIGPRTKAIIVVHIWGNPTNMDQVLEIARRHNLKVIEDCSHAHGALWKGRPVGSLGDIGVFSLQGAKPVAAGEGGVAVTDSPLLLDRMLAYGHQGRRVSGTLELAEPSAFFPVTGFGRKCRAHPLGIALAEIDLKWLRRRNAMLRVCWDALAQAVRGSRIVTMQTPSANASMAGYFLGGAVRITSQKVAPDHVCKIFEESGVSVARGVQKPNHILPHLYDRAYRTAMLGEEALPAAGAAPSLPHTEEAIRNVILMPLEQFVHGKRRRALVRALALLDKEA